MKYTALSLYQNAPGGSVYVLTSDGTEIALGSGSFAAGGDLTGNSSSQTVAKINGATVPAAGSLTSGHLLKVAGTSATSYGYLLNANVASDAAIAGSKISPDFGSQNVITTGALSLGSSPASSGTLRLPNGASIKSNNGSLGTADLLSASGTVLTVGDSSSVTILHDRASTYLTHRAPEHYFQNADGTTDWVKIDSTRVAVSLASLQFASTVSAPVVNQSAVSTNLGTGQTFQIAAQNATGTGSTGGNLILSAGSGTSANGVVRIGINGTTGIQFTPSNSGQSIYNVVAGATSVLFNQSSNTTNSATASSWTIQAQNATGTSATGGALILTSGTGTSASGPLRLQAGGSTALSVDSASQMTVSTVITKQTISSFADGYDITASATTTDATTTDLYTWTIQDNAVTTVDIRVAADQSTSAAADSWVGTISFRRDGGTVSTVDASDITQRGASAWVVLLDSSSSTGRLRITGAAATTIKWAAQISMLVVRES